jgi:hypothetical protein
VLDSEPVLFVDRGEPEPAEHRRLLHQGVCSNRQERRAARQLRRGTLSRRGFETSRDENRLDPEGLEQSRQSPGVLLGEELGGGHDRSLIAVLHGQERGKKSNDRLAAAYIALEQTVHLPIADHVGNYLSQRRSLRVGECEREHLLESRSQLALVLERNAVPLLSHQSIRATVEHMDEQQLLECEPRSPLCALGNRLRAVDHSHCFTQRWHHGESQYVIRQIFLEQRE